MFIMAFVLFMGVVLLGAALPKQGGSISQKREKGKPSAGLLFKGLYPFFFLLKFLRIAVDIPGCIRYIKTRIKGLFAQI